MVVTSIRQVGSLKPQVKVRELHVGQAEIPPMKWAMELANRFSIYKRSEPLMSHCTSSNAARGLVSRPNFSTQKSPCTPYIRCAQTTFRPLPHPNFSVFHPSFKKIFKNFFAPSARRCPPCAESLRRILAPLKNPGIPRQNRPFAPRDRPKITRKTPPPSPEKPTPHTISRKKVESFSLNSIDSPSEKVHT